MSDTVTRYIVADPKICHGKLTFLGTRILVADVLEQVASGMRWDTIVDAWDGKVRLEAIAESVRIASRALVGNGIASRNGRRRARPTARR